MNYLGSTNNSQANLSVVFSNSSLLPSPSLAPWNQLWYPDVGATHHVTLDLSSLSVFDNYKGTKKLFVGKSYGLEINHIRQTTLSFPFKSLALKNVL